MSELLRELQEDMQRERWAALWQRYGRYIIGGCVAVVVGTAGGVTYRHWRDGRDGAQTSKFLEAVEFGRQGKFSLAETAFAELEEDVPAHKRALVALRRADILRAGGKNAEADNAIASAAATVDGGDLYGTLVQLQALALGKGEAATVQVGTVFGHSADELRAWAALQAGKRDEASRLFAVLAGAPEAPASLRERAKLVLSMLDPAAIAGEGSHGKTE